MPLSGFEKSAETVVTATPGIAALSSRAVSSRRACVRETSAMFRPFFASSNANALPMPCGWLTRHGIEGEGSDATGE
jgi:hypothetical protein